MPLWHNIWMILIYGEVRTGIKSECGHNNYLADHLQFKENQFVICARRSKLFVIAIKELPAASGSSYWWWPAWQKDGLVLGPERGDNHHGQRRIYVAFKVWWYDIYCKQTTEKRMNNLELITNRLVTLSIWSTEEVLKDISESEIRSGSHSWRWSLQI